MCFWKKRMIESVTSLLQQIMFPRNRLVMFEKIFPGVPLK